MRCFVAIPLPESVKKKLAGLQQPIPKIRWQKGRKYHITLKFLGDVSENRVRALQNEFSSVKLPAFSVSLQGLGYFPKGRNPRVLWAGIEKSRSLTKLRDEVEKICVSIGFEAENRPFKPHITLARMKNASKKEVQSFINQHKNFEVQDITIDEFALYESKLHSVGAEHIRLKIFSLKGG